MNGLNIGRRVEQQHINATPAQQALSARCQTSRKPGVLLQDPGRPDQKVHERYPFDLTVVLGDGCASYHPCSHTDRKDDLMANLSLRGLAPEVLAALKAAAVKENASVNAVLLRLIDRALGRTSDKAGPVRHSDLDALAGSWKRGETKEFDDATCHFRSVDSSIWK